MPNVNVIPMGKRVNAAQHQTLDQVEIDEFKAKCVHISVSPAQNMRAISIRRKASPRAGVPGPVDRT
jgi:hypothetical protein